MASRSGSPPCGGSIPWCWPSRVILVAIARALIHNPTLVLADEPTASLDTERAFQVAQTFAALIHENERAGIMVTHDLRMCQYVDRVLQMRDGKLVREIQDSGEIAKLAKGE